MIFVIGLVSSDPDPIPDPEPNPFDILDSGTWFDDSDNVVGGDHHQRPGPHKPQSNNLDISDAVSKKLGKGDDECPPCPNCPHCPPCYPPPPPPHYAPPNKGGYHSKGGHY
jgi:hypothetical protein